MLPTQNRFEPDDKHVVIASTRPLRDDEIEHKTIFILCSLPAGFQGSYRPKEKGITAEGVYFLYGILLGIQDRKVKPDDVQIIIGGSITANDYLLKFPKEAPNVIDAFLKTYPQKTLQKLLKEEKKPEKHLAKLFAEFSRPIAIKKESALCEKHKKELEDIEKRNNSEYKLSFKHQLLGWETILTDLQKAKYDTGKEQVKELFDNNSKGFKDILYEAATDFLKNKGLEIKDGTYIVNEGSPIDTLINLLEEKFNFLGFSKKNWINFLIECGVLYLLEEAPFFLINKGIILYPDPIKKVFNILLDMNSDKLEIVKVNYEVEQKNNISTKLVGRSPSFEILPNNKKNKKPKNNSTDEKKHKEINKTQDPVIASKPDAFFQPAHPRKNKKSGKNIHDNKYEENKPLTSLSPASLHSEASLITNPLPNSNAFIEGIRSQPIEKQISIFHSLLGDWLKHFQTNTSNESDKNNTLRLK